MTRDGASSASDNRSASDGPQNMSVGGAILRTILALGLVLAGAFGTLKYLRKKGYGVPAASSQTMTAGDPMDQQQPGVAPLASTGPAPRKLGFGMSPIAQLIHQQHQQALANRQEQQQIEQRPNTALGFVPASGVSQLPIADLQFLGAQPLPGSSHTLYKIRVGDRVLLLGGSQSGGLNTLSEWDVETRPETEQRFGEILDQMALAAGSAQPARPLGSDTSAQAAALQNATRRLGQTVRRVAANGGGGATAVAPANGDSDASATGTDGE